MSAVDMGTQYRRTTASRLGITTLSAVDMGAQSRRTAASRLGRRPCRLSAVTAPASPFPPAAPPDPPRRRRRSPTVWGDDPGFAGGLRYALEIVTTALRLLARHWPALLTLFLAGVVAHELAMRAAVRDRKSVV